MVLGLTAAAEALWFENGGVIRKGGERMPDATMMPTSLPETVSSLVKWECKYVSED